MRTVFDQRRDNLRELARTWGGPTSLAKKLVLTVVQILQVLWMK